MTIDKRGAEWRMMMTLRGTVNSDHYFEAALLLDEVRKRITKKEAERDPGEAYAVLLRVADEQNVPNPFDNEDRFAISLSSSYDVDEFDWERLIWFSSEMISFLPKPVIDLFEERFSILPDTVLLAEAEKFVPYLKSIVDGHKESAFTLTTQYPTVGVALSKLFEGYENVEVSVTDIYSYGFIDKRFDLIMSSPAAGGRLLAEDSSFICRELDLVALENLALHLTDRGRLETVVPVRVTFASGKVDDLRQFIQSSYTLRELSELPEGTLMHTNIKMIFIDIERKRPEDEDIVVRRYSAAGRKSRKDSVEELGISEDTFVMLSELEEQGNWSIDRIFAQQDDSYIQFQNSDIKRVPLEAVAQVFRGKAVEKRKVTAVGRIGVVNISNIGLYELDYSSFDHFDEEERKVANYLLQEGDLLLPARGTAIRTAVFHEQDFPCIASSNVIVIRPNPKELNATYLKLFLDSPIGNKMISGMQQGTTIINISYKDLGAMDVPLPDMEEQENKAKKYSEELSLYKDTIDAAEKRWRETLNNLQTF